MDSTKGTTFRNHCLDDGLASIAEMETNFQSKQHQHHHQNPFVSKNPNSSFRNVSWVSSSSSSSSSPRSAPVRSFFVAGKFFEEPPQKSHFLDSCFLCKKLLSANKDIFMYRGDTPFCSEECRQEQIDMDEAKEKSRNLSASIRALRKKEQTKSSSSSSSTRTTSSDCTIRSSTVAAAS